MRALRRAGRRLRRAARGLAAALALAALPASAGSPAHGVAASLAEAASHGVAPPLARAPSQGAGLSPATAPPHGVASPAVDASPPYRVDPTPSDASLSAAAAAEEMSPPATPAPALAWRVRASHPHDPQAFTQGLLLHAGVLYESTGLHGRSSLRAVEPASGRVLRERRLPRALFGEGLARVGARLYQLTWRSGEGFVYALPGLQPVGGFRYPGEGWGLASDGKRLFMSDGSDRLRVIDPEGFRELARIAVHDAGAPVPYLNELEFAAGQLFANVWRSERIARIDPASGRVTGWLDLAGLLGPLSGPDVDVLNGIAWDPAARRLWVTGKLWPRIFEIEVEGL